MHGFLLQPKLCHPGLPVLLPIHGMFQVRHIQHRAACLPAREHVNCDLWKDWHLIQCSPHIFEAPREESPVLKTHHAMPQLLLKGGCTGFLAGKALPS